MPAQIEDHDERARSRRHVEAFVEHYRNKADSNKLAAKALALTSIVGSASIPVLLLLAIPIWVPALVSAAVAVATAWLQIRKHASRWALYRSAQRDLERELHDHEFGVGAYDGKLDSNRLLVQRANALVHKVHYEWKPTALNLQEAGRR